MEKFMRLRRDFRELNPNFETFKRPLLKLNKRFSVILFK